MLYALRTPEDGNKREKARGKEKTGKDERLKGSGGGWGLCS